MFTGLVQDLGTVDAQDGGRLRVRTELARELRLGDSIAVNGVCLTATEVDGDAFAADVMAETLRRTSLGAAAPGATVNLELPLRAADRLGGHVVQGHVDGTGTVDRVEHEPLARVVWITSPPELLRYIVPKGSVAIDGISLTVAALTDTALSVSLIPETVERTTLGRAEPGAVVNLEVDVLAKYVERLVNR
jgi:riboflavin synthase